MKSEIIHTPASMRKRRAGRVLRLFFIAALIIFGMLIAAIYVFPRHVFYAEFARQAWWAGVTKKSIQVDDHHWVYYEGGEGPTLVLLHGLAGAKENWLPSVRALSQFHHVIVPDLAGWNESTRLVDTDYGIATQAKRVDHFLAALNLSRVHLVGHSMGGHIAGITAARYPSRVAQLSLVDSAGVHFIENDFARRILRGETPFNVDSREQFDAFAQLMFVHKPFAPGPIVDIWVAQNQRNHTFHTSIVDQLGRGGETFLLEAELAKIKAPTQAIFCRQDQVLDVSSLDTMKKIKPDLVTHILEDCGHMPMMEKPAELAKVLISSIN